MEYHILSELKKKYGYFLKIWKCIIYENNNKVNNVNLLNLPYTCDNLEI